MLVFYHKDAIMMVKNKIWFYKEPILMIIAACNSCVNEFYLWAFAAIFCRYVISFSVVFGHCLVVWCELDTSTLSKNRFKSLPEQRDLVQYIMSPNRSKAKEEGKRFSYVFGIFHHHFLMYWVFTSFLEVNYLERYNYYAFVPNIPLFFLTILLFYILSLTQSIV